MLFSRRSLWRWPPVPGLLSNFLPVYLRERASWGIDDWKAYAAFLETEGAWQRQALAKSEHELMLARSRASRRKSAVGATPSPLGLLSPLPPRGRPGPKTKGRRFADAASVLALKVTLQAERKNVTNKAALAEWLKRQGKGHYRVNDHRSILNAMSEWSRRHKISAR